MAGTGQKSAAVNGAAYQVTNTGIVSAAIDSGMYTYQQVSGETEAVWLAAHKNGIAKGDVVKYSKGVAVRCFQSKSLMRTFNTAIVADAMELAEEQSTIVNFAG